MSAAIENALRRRSLKHRNPRHDAALLVVPVVLSCEALLLNPMLFLFQLALRGPSSYEVIGVPILQAVLLPFQYFAFARLENRNAT